MDLGLQGLEFWNGVLGLWCFGLACVVHQEQEGNPLCWESANFQDRVGLPATA